jgi:hypothetical protein
MALTTVNYVRPKLSGTLNEAYTAQYKTYEDTTNALIITDEYATINAALRLIERTVISTARTGVQKTSTINVYTYESSAATTYVDTDLASATTAPFTIAQGTLRNTFVGYPVDLDAIYSTAGDARANS